MKKVGIVTIIDDNNYGNRLQNYAVQEFLKKNYIQPVTIKNNPTLNTKDKYIFRLIKYLKETLLKKESYSTRKTRFGEFNKNIQYTDKIVTPFSKVYKKYDYFMVGSDQVWNPNFCRLRDIDLLSFAKNSQKVAFSASFGINELPEQFKEKTSKSLKDFKAISVREDAGKKIV